MPLKNTLFIALAVGIILLLRLVKKRGWIRQRWLHRMAGIIGKTIAVGLIMWAVLFQNLPSVKTTGPYRYQSQTIQLEDSGRTETYIKEGGPRKLAVMVLWPDDPGLAPHTLPLVLFSHGGIAAMQSNQSLYEELASHGYVVAAIGHTYHALSTPIDGKTAWINLGYLGEINGENSHRDPEGSLRLFRKWMDLRVADMAFVLDSLLKGQGDAPFYQLIDASRIGLAGHSLGGAAAYGLARQRQDIGAVLALESPYMADITGIDGEDFTWDTAPYTCAMMNIYSDTGLPLVENDHKYAQNKRLEAQGAAESHHLPGSNHFTLTDLSLVSPLLCTLLGSSYETPGAETLTAINRLGLAFFDAHLQGQAPSD